LLTALGAAELDVITLEPADYIRAARLVEQYADLPLGAVDAAVIPVAERLADAEVASRGRRSEPACPTGTPPAHSHRRA